MTNHNYNYNFSNQSEIRMNQNNDENKQNLMNFQKIYKKYYYTFEKENKLVKCFENLGTQEKINILLDSVNDKNFPKKIKNFGFVLNMFEKEKGIYNDFSDKIMYELLVVLVHMMDIRKLRYYEYNKYRNFMVDEIENKMAELFSSLSYEFAKIFVVTIIFKKYYNISNESIMRVMKLFINNSENNHIFSIVNEIMCSCDKETYLQMKTYLSDKFINFELFCSQKQIRELKINQDQLINDNNQIFINLQQKFQDQEQKFQDQEHKFQQLYQYQEERLYELYQYQEDRMQQLDKYHETRLNEQLHKLCEYHETRLQEQLSSLNQYHENKLQEQIDLMTKSFEDKIKSLQEQVEKLKEEHELFQSFSSIPLNSLPNNNLNLDHTKNNNHGHGQRFDSYDDNECSNSEKPSSVTTLTFANVKKSQGAFKAEENANAEIVNTLNVENIDNEEILSFSTVSSCSNASTPISIDEFEYVYLRDPQNK
jgi:hypothetical protein